MATTVINATQPYGGYKRVASQTADLYLTDTNRGAPAGEYLRRYWHPICLSSDLGEFPKAISVLGEKLVVFRDLSGDVGLVHRDCSHRGTSLEFGLIVEHGIRCAYHGWHYGVDGQILDAPGERARGSIAKRMCHPAYPVREFRGLVFAYLGPPESKPEFPDYDFMNYEGEEYVPFSWHMACNWVQVRENTQDPIHLTFLHTMFAVKQFGGDAYDLPLIKAHQTPIGQVTTSTRCAGDYVTCRINEVILPNIARVPDGYATGAGIPANKAGIPEEGKEMPPLVYKRQIPSSHRLGLSTWVVPLDNGNCVHIGWIHVPEGEDPEVRDQWIEQVSFGQTGDRPAEERRRNPGDWDAMIAQGVTAINQNENLTPADVGIGLFRRQLRQAIQTSETNESMEGVKIVNDPHSYGYMLVSPTAAFPGLDEDAIKVAFEKQCIDQILSQNAPDSPRELHRF